MPTEINKRFDQKCPVINRKDTEDIKCSNCKKTLFIVHHTPLTDKVLYNIVVECPFCQDKSFEFSVMGEFQWEVVPGIQLRNRVENEEQKLVIFKTKRVMK